MRFLRRQSIKTAKGTSPCKAQFQGGCLCGLLTLKKTNKGNVASLPEDKIFNESSTPTKEVTVDDGTDDEEYYTAQSFFCDGTTVRGQATELRRLKELDARAPTVIPQDAISALNLEPPFCTQLPSEMKVAGLWRKDSNLSTPIPNAVEDVLNSSMFVQSVKKRIRDFEIQETPETFSFVVKIPVPYYKPRVETFRKDGTVAEIPHRRDDRSGTSFGQAFALIDGRVVVRVWNVGASPEIMMQEIFEFSNSNKLKVEHSIFTLDGKSKAKKVTVAFKVT